MTRSRVLLAVAVVGLVVAVWLAPREQTSVAPPLVAAPPAAPEPGQLPPPRAVLVSPAELLDGGGGEELGEPGAELTVRAP